MRCGVCCWLSLHSWRQRARPACQQPRCPLDGFDLLGHPHYDSSHDGAHVPHLWATDIEHDARSASSILGRVSGQPTLARMLSIPVGFAQARRFPRRTAIAVACMLLIVLALIVVVLLHLPRPFYRRALVVSDAEHRQAARELVSMASVLFSDGATTGAWRAQFSAKQCNGWLATDLPEKHADLLPARIREPRVEIRADRLSIGFHYHGRRVTAVVCVDVELSMARPNEVAVRLLRASAGRLPLPIMRVAAYLQREAIERRWPVRWLQVKGAPTFLVSLPVENCEGRPRREIETITLRDYNLIVSGRTWDRVADSRAAPGPSTNSGRTGGLAVAIQDP